MSNEIRKYNETIAKMEKLIQEIEPQYREAMESELAKVINWRELAIAEHLNQDIEIDWDATPTTEAGELDLVDWENEIVW